MTIRLCSLKKNSFCICGVILRYNRIRQINIYASKGPTARVGPIFGLPTTLLFPGLFLFPFDFS